MQDNEQYGILISNLDANVTSKQLSDFFSFCGKITSLSLRKKEDTAEAVLIFEKEESAKTALLLNNALIKDKPMTVQPYTEARQEIHQSEDNLAQKQEEKGEEPAVNVREVPEENITQRPAAGERVPFSFSSKNIFINIYQTATATIASLIAGGYVLAVDTLDQAKKLDEEKNISSTVKQGTETIKSKAAELDKQYGISEKAGSTSRAINEQWNQLDEQYGISKNANTASESVSETVSGWGSAVASGLSNTFQTPAVQNTLASMSEWTNNVGRSIGTFLQPATDTVTREFNDIKEQSTREINEKQRERAEAKEGIQMEELGDMKEETAPDAISLAKDPLVEPSPETESIPQPSAMDE